MADISTPFNVRRGSRCPVLSGLDCTGFTLVYPEEPFGRWLWPVSASGSGRGPGGNGERRSPRNLKPLEQKGMWLTPIALSSSGFHQWGVQLALAPCICPRTQEVRFISASQNLHPKVERNTIKFGCSQCPTPRGSWGAVDFGPQ